jgi:integrase
MPKLSDTRVRSAKARAKPYKISDADGLYLIVRPDGRRWWRVKYRWSGKEQTLSLGVYPDTSLATARKGCAAIRVQLAENINPGEQRREAKLAQISSAERTYKAIAVEWLSTTGDALQWTPAHRARIGRRREVHFDPWLGRKDIGDVTEQDIATRLDHLVRARLFDTARRARSENHQLFRFAKQRRLIAHNPVTELLGPGALPSAKVKHHAALKDPVQVGALLRAIDAYHGGAVVRSALQFLPHVFVRPGELQNAVWSEFDLDGAEWRIPAARMKMGEHHIVPLSRQAIAILRELHVLTGPQGYVFPQVRNASRPISENTLNASLRGLGFDKNQQTAHGFRSTASTLLNEQGFNPDAIERQLAHGERNKVRAAYNAAQHLPERRKMMQAWSDYLGGLKAIPLKAAA